jgi:tetratricopeptide (TPR) repeat protein
MNEALEVIDELLNDCGQRPSWAGPFSVKAAALHMLGRHEEELRVARQCVEDFPDEYYCRYYEAVALSALGKLDDLQVVIDDSITMAAQDESTALTHSGLDAGLVLGAASRELLAHGHPDTSRMVADRLVEWRKNLMGESEATRDQLLNLAEALYLAEQWDEAQDLFERLADCRVGDINGEEDYVCLSIQGSLGALAARRGDPETARRISGELAKVEVDPWGRSHGHRVPIALFLGQRDQALDLLREAFAHGYGGVGGGAHANPNLRPLWDDPEFQELVRPKG